MSHAIKTFQRQLFGHDFAKHPLVLSDDDRAVIDGYKAYTTEFDRVLTIQQLLSEKPTLQQALDEGHININASFRNIAEYNAKNLGSLSAPYFEALNRASDQNRKNPKPIAVGEPVEFTEWQTLKKHARERIRTQIAGMVRASEALLTRNRRDKSGTAVTILINLAGSHKNTPNSYLPFFMCDMLAKVFAQQSINFEILAQSSPWRGGNARLKWKNGDRAKNPGRLNDLDRYVIKGFDDDYLAARDGLGITLVPSVAKENIDGEAIIWAHQRLVNRPEQRRVLIVLGDGNPSCDATNSHNSIGGKVTNAYLVQHRDAVVRAITANSPARIIGVGFDTDRVLKAAFPNVIALDPNITLPKEFKRVMAQILVELDDMIDHKLWGRKDRKTQPLGPIMR